MIISKNIPLDAKSVIEEIKQRQTASWNDGRINDFSQFPTLEKLFEIMNSGIPKENFFFQGDLYRLHTPYTKCFSTVDFEKEEVLNEPCQDGSCSVLPKTVFTSDLAAFSKSFDFTDKKAFPKVDFEEKAVLLHFNTHDCYGIDVNKLLKRFNCENRFEKEQEVLFPVAKNYLIKEYRGTPNEFKQIFMNKK